MTWTTVLVSFDDWYLMDCRRAPDHWHGVKSTVVHELVHTWFGEQVVCFDFSHIFFKETVATLLSAEWYHHGNGIEDMHYILALYRN